MVLDVIEVNKVIMNSRRDDDIDRLMSSEDVVTHPTGNTST